MSTDKINFAKFSISTLIIALVVVLFSCKDDDEQQPLPLVATWTSTKDVYSNCDDPDWNATVTYNCSADVQECIKTTFTNDNKVTIVFGDGAISINGTYSISGNTLTITISSDSKVFTFNVSGNTLTLTSNDDGCDITETYVKS